MFLLGMGGIIGIIVGCIALIVLVIAFISGYNNLVKLKNKVKNAWSQIDVVLKRRFDLIPNLVETVKGYATHEKEIWEDFASARGSYVDASKNNSVKDMAKASESLGNTLSRLLVVSEQYPELKANANFQNLMSELKDTENKIQYARQFYNDIVNKYNDKVEMFPSNIVARLFKFELKEFFEIEDQSHKEAPKVSF